MFDNNFISKSESKEDLKQVKQTLYFHINQDAFDIQKYVCKWMYPYKFNYDSVNESIFLDFKPRITRSLSLSDNEL